MNIPLVSSAPMGAAALITPITATQVSAAGQTQAAAALVAQTTVDLSPLGRFLSAVTLFQKRLLELQANPAAGEAQAASEESIAALASSAVALSASANDLQASLITGTSDDPSLATLFSQQFNAQGADDSADLAAIGLTLTSDPGQAAVLKVDTAVLQAALGTDPAGTTALLERTAAAFGVLTRVAAEAGVDPTVLLADDSAVAGLPTPAANQDAQALPEFAAPIPAQGTDDAFLQELLAETPKPVLALSQAPPPAVAEANASFAAERAADNAVSTLPPTLPPTLPSTAPAIASYAAAVASAVDDAAQTNAGAPRPVAEADKPTLPLQASAQTARMLDEQAVENNAAQRGANNLIADSIEAERDANERITNAIAAGRATQAGAAQTRESAEAAAMRATDNALEQRRLDEEGAQTRLGQALEGRRFAKAPELAEPAELGAPLRDRLVAAVVQPVPATMRSDAVAAPLAQPLPVNNAQQLARDPAIAAAIAAYNLNAGPFASLNARPEIAAQRPKIVPAVDSVTAVAAIETDAATSDSARPFR